MIMIVSLISYEMLALEVLISIVKIRLRAYPVRVWKTSVKYNFSLKYYSQT